MERQFISNKNFKFSGPIWLRNQGEEIDTATGLNDSLNSTFYYPHASQYK